MFCRIIHSEILKLNETLNAYFFIPQLERVHKFVVENHPRAVQLESMLLSSMTTQGHMQQRKQIESRFVCYTLPNIFTWPCTKRLLLFLIVAKRFDRGNHL